MEIIDIEVGHISVTVKHGEDRDPDTIYRVGSVQFLLNTKTQSFGGGERGWAEVKVEISQRRQTKSKRRAGRKIKVQ